MTEDLDMIDLAACLRYRIAYGEAANLLEASKYDHSFGRAFAARVEGQAVEILAAVLHRVGEERRDLVELAIADVMAGRRPRW